MNSKERVKIAMQGGIPDRVPFMCQLATGHYFLHSGLDPMDIWFTSEGFADALVIMQKRYQFDGILVNLHGRPPNWKELVSKIEDKPGEKWIWWKNGNFTKFPPDDNPHYYLGDETRYFPTFEQIDPEKLHYVEPWDLTGINYPFIWDFEEMPRNKDDFFPSYLSDTLKKVIQKVGDEVSVHGEVFSPFSQFLELLNYEMALMALMDDSNKAHACLDALTNGAIELGVKEVGWGADAVLISSAFAGSPFLSTQFYEEFVLPYEKKLVEGIKAVKDVPIYTHTCGGIGDRLDLMMATGTNGIDTLDPPPLGTVELEEALEQTKGKVFIKGNIDPVNTLLMGSEDALEKAVANRLEAAAPGGGYILSTACSVAPPTKPERIEYMSRLVRENGSY